ncbi:MAG: helix-turn-helix domain-containing protein [Candidatus Bathyarchaeia archaeon]
MKLALEQTDDLVRVYDDKSEVWKFIKRDKGVSGQLMMIEETLSRYGLLKNEIRVYLYLARFGERKAGEVAESISLHRTETYRILRDLEKKGIVFSVFEKPLKFTAVPLDKAIDLLIEAEKMKIQLLEKEKAGLVNIWQSMPQPKVEKVKKQIFQILEGGQQILLKANELLERSKNEFQIFVPSDYLSQLYHGDFTDKLAKHLSKLNVTLLTENSPKSKFFLEQMKWPQQNYRIVDAEDLPCFMISDRKELLIAVEENDVSGEDSDKKKSKTVALWTNYNAFVLTLQTLLSKLLETGKTVHEICVRRSN